MRSRRRAVPACWATSPSRSTTAGAAGSPATARPRRRPRTCAPCGLATAGTRATALAAWPFARSRPRPDSGSPSLRARCPAGSWQRCTASSSRCCCRSLSSSSPCSIAVFERYARRHRLRVLGVAAGVDGLDGGAAAEARRGDEVGALEASVADLADRLEEHDRSRARFVSQLSHDLRTPLTIIKSYAWSLRAREKAPARLERLQTIEDEADRVAALVDDLLTLGRLRAVSLSVEPQTCDPTAVLTRICAPRHVLAAERGVALRVAFAGIEPLDVDPLRFGQIVGEPRRQRARPRRRGRHRRGLAVRARERDRAQRRGRRPGHSGSPARPRLPAVLSRCRWAARSWTRTGDRARARRGARRARHGGRRPAGRGALRRRAAACAGR